MSKRTLDDVLKQAKQWLKDRPWTNYSDRVRMDQFSREDCEKYLTKYYKGGVQAFLESNDAKAPVQKPWMLRG